LKNWLAVLKKDPTQRLLRQASPMDRYYILIEVLGRSKTDSEVADLRRNLIDEILSKQLENGSWGNKVYDYEKGTTHQLMKLVELGLTAQDGPIKKGVDYLLRFQVENGSFVQGKTGCGLESNLVMTNAVALALARTGYSDDPRTAKAYEWLCSWQQEDGSWLSPHARKRRDEGKGYPHPFCGLHATCNVLLGLSATERTRKSEAAKRGANYLFSLYGYKYDIEGSVKPPYFRAILEKELVPYGGAWFDPRCIPPQVGVIPQEGLDRKVEIITTAHILGTLSMLGYGLENEKVKNGLNRLISLLKEDEITLYTMMVVKSLYQPFSVFTFHGH